MDEIDYSTYPDRSFQIRWLRDYLEVKFIDQGGLPSDVTDNDVERLHVQVNHFVLVCHVYVYLFCTGMSRICLFV